MKKKKIYILVLLAFIIGVGYSAFYKWSVEHVLYMTGGVAHPIGCVSCHVYPEREGFVANLFNEDYLSPLNATVNDDGSKLYVIAQDADQLIEVDLSNNEVLATINVGRRPHSVLLSDDQKSAFVSNQWANNMYIIDLENHQVVDTIIT